MMKLMMRSDSSMFRRPEGVSTGGTLVVAFLLLAVAGGLRFGLLEVTGPLFEVGNRLVGLVKR
jgi:hypothetical protein